MAAGDKVEIVNPIYKDDERYGPGQEVAASRFTKAELEWMTAGGHVRLIHAADEPKAATKAKAPKEAGAHAQTESAPDAAEGSK